MVSSLINGYVQEFLGIYRNILYRDIREYMGINCNVKEYMRIHSNIQELLSPGMAFVLTSSCHQSSLFGCL